MDVQDSCQGVPGLAESRPRLDLVAPQLEVFGPSKIVPGLCNIFKSDPAMLVLLNLLVLAQMIALAATGEDACARPDL